MEPTDDIGLTLRALEASLKTAYNLAFKQGRITAAVPDGGNTSQPVDLASEIERNDVLEDRLTFQLGRLYVARLPHDHKTKVEAHHFGGFKIPCTSDCAEIRGTDEIQAVVVSLDYYHSSLKAIGFDDGFSARDKSITTSHIGGVIDESVEKMDTIVKAFTAGLIPRTESADD